MQAKYPSKTATLVALSPMLSVVLVETYSSSYSGVLQKLPSLCFEGESWESQTSTLATLTSWRSVPYSEGRLLQLPMLMDGNQYAVLFMDYSTTWLEVFAVPDQTAETIARLLVEQVIPRHGVPELLLSDQGKNVLSLLIQEVCKLIGTKRINTSGYHPQCDGLVGKFNSTLISMLSKIVGKYGQVRDKHFPYLLLAYHVAVHELIKASPFYLYGREPQVPTSDALAQPRTIY